MKLEVLQENLSSALRDIQKIVPSKPQLPILSSILIKARKSDLSLAATDLYVGMRTTVKGKIEQTGQVAIPGKLFYRSINSLQPGKLQIELQEDSLIISSSSNETTIQCLPVAEFPEFPKIEGQQIELTTDVIEKIDDKVTFSASLDQTRPVLTALLFEFSQDGLLTVGTDGFRLATLKLSTQKQEIRESFLIPAKAVTEIANLSQRENDSNPNFVVSEELKQALFRVGDTELFVRLIEGEYPPFNKIIPEEFALEAEIDGQALENQLKRAQVFAQEASNIVRLIFTPDKLKVVAKSPSFGQQEGELNYQLVRGEVKENEIAFNTKYLLDFFNALKPEKVQFCMNGSLTPAMLRPAGEDNYRHIVMPFRVNQ